jgi:hypothetical protein
LWLELLEERRVPAGGVALGVGQSIGAFDPATATWYLRNEAGGGAPDGGTFQFGGAGWQPLAGDWTGSGHAGIGAYDPGTGTFYLRNTAGPGAPDFVIPFGAPGWKAVVGDWSGGGHAGLGVFDPATATFYLRNEVNAGGPDAGQFPFGGGNWVPLAGNWGGGASLPPDVAAALATAGLDAGSLGAAGGDPTLISGTLIVKTPTVATARPASPSRRAPRRPTASPSPTTASPSAASAASARSSTSGPTPTTR